MSYKIGSRRAQDITSGQLDKERIGEVEEGVVTAHEAALEPLLELGNLAVSDVDMGNNVIKFSADPSSDEEASRKKYVDDQDAVVQGAVDTEKARAEAAEASLSSDISAEASARASADTALQANIDVEKGRVDAILSAADADKDSFAEIVTLINSIDTDNDDALAGAVTTLNASIAAVQADVDGNESDGDTDRALIRSEFAAADSSEASARAAADTALQSNIDAEASTARAAESANATAISDEETRALAAEASLSSSISSESSARAAADSAEASARASADTTLQSNIDTEKARAEAAEAQLTSDLSAEASARASADTSLQSNIDVEKARLDVLEGDSSVSGSVAKAIADVIDAAPEALNTLKELAEALGDDSDFAATITAAVSAEETARIAADSAEASARAAGDAAVQSDLDTFKARTDNPHSVTPAQLSLVVGTDVQGFDPTLEQLSGAWHSDDGSYVPVYYGDSYNGTDGEANSVSYQRVGRYTSGPIVEPVQEMFLAGSSSTMYSLTAKYNLLRTDGMSSGDVTHDLTLPSINTDYSVGDLGKTMVIKADALVNSGSNAVSMLLTAGGTGTTANIDGSSTFVLDDPYSAITLLATSTGWRIV